MHRAGTGSKPAVGASEGGKIGTGTVGALTGVSVGELLGDKVGAFEIVDDWIDVGQREQLKQAQGGAH